MNNRNGNTGAGTGSTVGSNLDSKIESIKDNMKNLVDQGSEKVGQIKSRVIDVKDQAMSRGNAFVDKATDMIRAHPLKAVGIAFGVGYIGMRLFRR